MWGLLHIHKEKGGPVALGQSVLKRARGHPVLPAPMTGPQITPGLKTFPLRGLGPLAVQPQQCYFPLGAAVLLGLWAQWAALPPSASRPHTAAQHLLGGRDQVGVALGVVGAGPRVGGEQR